MRALPLHACVLVLALLTGVSNARAHASLLGSDPADGARLTRAPATVELRFDEAVTPIGLRLFGPSGAATTLALPADSTANLRVALPAGLADGSHLLSYRVTSADAHPVAGSIAFAIGVEASSDPHTRQHAHPHAQDGAVNDRLLARAVHAARDLALLIAAGAGLFAALRPARSRHPDLARDTVRRATPVAALFCLGLLGTHGQALTGDGQWLTAANWDAALHTSFGTSVLAALAGLALLAGGSWWRAAHLTRACLATGALLVCAAFGLTGHAAAAHPVWAKPALMLHTLAAAFWLGALVCLARLARAANANGASRDSVAQARTSLLVFARWAPSVVGLLVLAGAAFATNPLQALHQLLRTDYGNWLSLKLLLLVVLLGLALYNRLILTPRVERGEAAALARLRHSIHCEIALLVAVLGATAALGTTPPPRQPPAFPVLSSAGRTATLIRAPDGIAGPKGGGGKALDILLREPDGAPLAAADAWLELAQPARGIETLTRPLALIGPGHYRYDGPELAMPGAWHLTVGARLGEFDRLEWSTTLPAP